MAQEYRRTRIKRFAQLEERETPEARYWRKFKYPVVVKQIAPVTHIDFSLAGPYDYAVTAGTRVTLYDGKTNKEKRVLSKYKDTVYSGVFRADGKLVASGGVRPVVNVVDVKTKATLRSYSGHSAPVHVVRFAHDGIHLLSASDDKSVRYWDMASGTAVSTLENAHEDYIRCASVGGGGGGGGIGNGGGASASSNLSGAVWATGSYDHVARLWDSRALRGSSNSNNSSGRSNIGAGSAANDSEEEEEEGEQLDEEEEEEEEKEEVDQGEQSVDTDNDAEFDDEDDENDDTDINDNDDQERNTASRGGGQTHHSSTSSSTNPRLAPRPGCVLAVDHGEPITQVLLLPGGGTLLTAGSNTCKLWDVIGGGRLVHTFSAHAKLITSLALDGTATRLLSGGLDGVVKVYELGTFAVTAHLRYAAPILALNTSPDNSRLVVGCADGTLHVRGRALKMGEALLEKRAASVLRSGSYRYFLRGGGNGKGNNEATVDDIAPSLDRKPKLSSHDKLLKSFAHGAALDAVLSSSTAPVVTISVLEELLARTALPAALEGRDEVTLRPLLEFISKYIAHPRYASTCIDVAHIVVDMFAPLLGRSLPLSSMFMRLQQRLRTEIAVDAELLRFQGSLDALMAAASATGGGGAIGAGEE